MEGDNQEEELFEKPKGNRRWLGKEHYKGKDNLHQILKNEKMIEKTVNFGENQKKMKILDKECGDNLDIDVKYSLNKKQRWNLTENYVDMLKMVPDSIEAQIVERNILREDAGTFAVHSKIRNEKDPDDFDIRSAYTSGSGQHYSNFLPESRELSEKKKGKKKEEEKDEEKYSTPTVIYNIYRAHKSKEVMDISDGKKTKKSRKNRKNYEYREEEEEDYEEEEEDLENEEEDLENDRKILEYSEYMIEKKKEKKPKKKEIIENGRELEGNSRSFENIFNISEYLNQYPYTLFDSAIHFTNISTKNIEMKNEVKKLIEKGIKVDIISEKDIIVDISKWMISNGKKEGQTELLIGITHINKRICRFIINSTIQIQQNNDAIRSKIAISKDFYEVIENITKIFKSNRILNENQQNIEQGLIIDDMYINDNTNDQLFNCQYTCQSGTSIDWSFICDTVHSPSSFSDFNYFSNGICSICNQHQFNGLYSNTCSSCISSHFYHQFSSHRIPINISYSILQRIIPLPILNLYTCQLFENLSNYQNFEKCPNCMTLQTFDIDRKQWKIDHKCTNCDYEYCSKCQKDCHWPMKCLEYEEWNKQWNIRYCLENAQGNGQNTLVRIVCQCRKGIFYVKMPSDEYISCPKCKICISMEKMKIIMKREYVPWSGNCDKWWNDHWHNRKNEENGFDSKLFVAHSDFAPHSFSTTSINKIPAMPKSVIEICKNARDSRKTEKDIGYLSEMITGWMYIRRNQSENSEEFKKIRKILENLKEEDIEMLIKRVNSINK